MRSSSFIDECLTDNRDFLLKEQGTEHTIILVSEGITYKQSRLGSTPFTIQARANVCLFFRDGQDNRESPF